MANKSPDHNKIELPGPSSLGDAPAWLYTALMVALVLTAVALFCVVTGGIP